jgi:predicted nuclease of predicted toxin-antitoxin system
VRFYLDEHFAPVIAVIARGLGLDVVSALELGNGGLSDVSQLELAAQDDRCLVTKDREDFARLTLSFLERQKPHHGVLIVPRSLPSNYFSGIANALQQYAEAHPDARLDHVVDYL